MNSDRPTPEPPAPETYRLARPPGSTWRPYTEAESPPTGAFLESHPATPSPRDTPVQERSRPQRRRHKHPLAQLLLGHLPLETETTVFILVSLLDFFVTYWLLITHHRFFESNPVARFFIESWGPVKGMLGFKLAVVTFVCVVAQLIAIRREDLGRKVLLFGTVATGSVVVYSVSLYLRHA